MLGSLGGVDGDAQPDVAALGELDRVVEETDQDLPESSRVADHMVGYFGADVGGQGKALLISTRDKRFERRSDAISQAESARREFHPAALNFVKIQDAVDYVEQHVCRRIRHVEMFTLFGVEFGLEDQLRHADNSVHRGADFVAHIGNELALRSACRFGGFFGPSQFAFHQIARGHVACHAEHDLVLLRPIGGPEHRNQGTIPATVPILKIVCRVAAHDGSANGDAFLPVVGMDHLEVRLPNELLRWITPQDFTRAINLKESPLPVESANDVQGVIHDLLVSVLGPGTLQNLLLQSGIDVRQFRGSLQHSRFQVNVSLMSTFPQQRFLALENPEGIGSDPDQDGEGHRIGDC